MSVHNDDYRNPRLASSVHADHTFLCHATSTAPTHAHMP